MSYILNTKFQSQTIFLNSAGAMSRDPFTFNFANSISCPTNMRMLISVEEFIIPNCFYNITDENNTLVFSIISGSVSVSILPNLYNANSFTAALNVELIPHNITAVYNLKTYKISFVSTTPISLLSCTCPNIIGVSKNNNNEYIFPVLSSLPSYTISLLSCVDFSGSSHIFLKCGDLMFQNINSKGEINSTLCRIPVNAPYGFKIFYRPNEPIKFMTSRANINTLTFNLVDVNNKIINIGGSEFQILMKIDYIYTPTEQGDILEGTLLHYITSLPDEEEPDENEFE